MTKDKANKMWGGRFSEKPADIMEQINVCLDVDIRLWRQDIAGSKAHCQMLVKQKIIPAEDGRLIIEGLEQIEKEIENGTFEFKSELEDIHMNVESRLKEIIGDAAGRLHTARSRNDQVATDLKMWVRDAISDIVAKIEGLQEALQDVADDHKNSIMPGFTHLQAAQPVTLALHMEAYGHMLNRDKTRLLDCAKRMNKCPLGAAALAGTPYPIDREYTAEKLGFNRPMINSLDAVSDRDYVAEFIFASAQCGMHLSRLAEEIIIWATPQFGFISLADQWSTGSSIMPQKKNPDAAELIRGKTGAFNGALIQIMTVMKGLPLAYNKDMQETKGPAIETFDNISLCLQAMTGMISTATFNTARMLEAAEDGYTTATALADWVVMELGLPFREAHHITGAIVKLAEEKGLKLSELALKDLQSVDSRITDDVYRVLSVKKTA